MPNKIKKICYNYTMKISKNILQKNKKYQKYKIRVKCRSNVKIPILKFFLMIIVIANTKKTKIWLNLKI